MPTTAPSIPRLLSLTLEQARDRIVEQEGTRGPTAKSGTVWWSLADPTTNDCLGFVLWALGVRDRDDFWNPLVSIRGFRAVAGWHEVEPEEIRPGDLVLWDWEQDDDVDHIEFVYSISRRLGTITTISANTSPRPGQKITAENRGVYRKTRPIDGKIRGGIRPPYRAPVSSTTSTDRKNVRIAASYLNATVPAVFEGEPVLRSASGSFPGSTVKGDGIRGPLYWTLVQTWGRLHGLYGKTFEIDGIPGPQSRRVEAEILRRAKASRYAKAA